MLRVFLSLACAVLLITLVVPPAGVAKSHATPTPAPTQAPVDDPAITKLARQQFVDWQAATLNKSLYASRVLPQLTAEKVTDTSKALAQLGALNDMVFIGPWINPDFPPGSRGFIYQMRCSEGNVYLWLALDPAGKIATIFFKNRLDVETVTPAPSPSTPG
jgi:hypothetical protein